MTPAEIAKALRDGTTRLIAVGVPETRERRDALDEAAQTIAGILAGWNPSRSKRSEESPLPTKGEIVVLKSGGPKMTVAAVGSLIFCDWFSGDELHTGQFSEAELRLEKELHVRVTTNEPRFFDANARVATWKDSGS